jgi:hypothetical protein
MPSAKKARLTPKAMILGPEKGLVVCEDADIVSKGEMPSAKTIPIRDEFRGFMSVVSDKENQSEMSMDDWSSRKLDGLGKEKKVGSKWHLFSSLSAHLCCNAHHCE